MSKFQEYVPIYEGDRYCLMCGQACPVRRVTKNEATSPHGWALLVASVQRGQLQWDAESVDVLYRCADAGNCQGNCATDRPLPYALMAARAEVVRLGRAPASALGVDDQLRRWGTPYGEPPAGDGFEETWKAAERAPAADGRARRAALLVGDAAHFYRPQAVAAAERLLRALDVEPVAFRAGRSSGYLPYALGLWDTARAFAEENVRALKASGAPLLLTLGTQDAHTLLHIYAELGVALPDTLNVMTLVDFLAQASAGDRLMLTPRGYRPYTYHDPSQALRLQGHGLNARVLATEVMGGEPLEMLFRENLATTAGTSGGLAFTHPELAASLARLRVREARETGAEILLTDDPLDTATLGRYAEELEVLNLFEVLAEGIR